VATKLDNERQTLRGCRSSRIFSRTVDSERRAPIYIDSFFSIDGIPISIEGRRKTEEERKNSRWGLKMNFLRKHPLCAVYLSIMFLIGIIWQVGLFHV